MKLMLVLLVGLVSIAPCAFADVDAPFTFGNVRVLDPDHVSDERLVKRAIDLDALAKCEHKANARVMIWIVFEGGNVVASDAAGSGDRKLEACIAHTVRSAGQAAKGRIAATVELVATSPPNSKGTPGKGPPVLMKDGPINADPSAALISSTIDNHAVSFRACYEQRLKDKPDLDGRLQVAFKIGGSGDVSAASVVSSLDATVDGCVVRELKTLHFPPSTSPANVNYPFVFHRAP